mmetsp:Transcript_57311/g.166323  ORF Transcript_57311/g.166323 Transcript_57311/m.166323 type:complete len:269 (-) Transcript_57311:73-879(-)
MASASSSPHDGDSQKPPEFGDVRYWEEVYGQTGAEGEVFDWLQGWPGLGWLMEPLLARDPERSVLHLGCGTSTLAEDFYDHGFRQQTSVDVVPSVIAQMAARNKAVRPEMRWVVADATSIGDALPPASFDLVVEKSTLDALLCTDDHAQAVVGLLREAARLVRPAGVFLSVSMHGPHVLSRWLRQPAFGWQVRVVELQGDPEDAAPRSSGGGGRRRNSHYAYVCTRHPRRGPPTQEARDSLWDRVTARAASDVSDVPSSRSPPSSEGE